VAWVGVHFRLDFSPVRSKLINEIQLDASIKHQIVISFPTILFINPHR
jgi:hypothetical protein